MTEGIDKEVKAVVESLKGNRFNPVEFVEKTDEAAKKVLDMIPSGVKVGMGGSMSLGQLNITEELVKRGSLDRSQYDIFLTSSNAITLDGKLVNIDMRGNRVADMIFGPKNVIVVAGMNKIVPDVHAACDRIKNVIAPYHAKTMGVKTPCAIEGKCSDCNSPDRICNITTILEKKPLSTEIAIILVGEDIGLGWDPEWPEERRERIASAYKDEMKKLMARFRSTRSKDQ